MLTEFELLIKELESEKLVLDEELQECLNKKDYKYADYFQKGIWRIERKIDWLKRLNRNPTSPDTQHLVDANTIGEMHQAYHYVYLPFMKKSMASLGINFHEETAGLEFMVEANQSCDNILTKLAVLMFDILQLRPEASGYLKREYYT